MNFRVLAIVCLTGWTIASPVSAESWLIEVSAGNHDRQGTPLTCELPDSLKVDPTRTKVVLTPVDGAGLPPVEGQIVPGERDTLRWRLERPLKRGESRRYALRIEADASSGPMTCTESADHLEIRKGTRLVLRYLKTPGPEAAANEPYYSRTGYIHPLLTPLGHSVTGDYPADHPHQHGLFFAWTNTEFEGRKLNFWDQKGQTGRISYRSTGDLKSGGVVGQFTVSQRHEDITTPDSPKAVLDETWTVTAWMNQGDEKGTILDIVSRQV
ncbi:MAG: PmoA family protein, partial [Verrucomicrobiae bacterium]|nr:PmoA family protein [Verrucomicrobiae bacterium]